MIRSQQFSIFVVANVLAVVLLVLIELTHLCRVESSRSSLWTGPFPTEGVSGKLLSFPCFIEIPLFSTNSVDPDQTPRSVTSDLSLLCLPTISWITRHK